LKLIDFGSATFITIGKSLNKQIGTSYYIAPEVLEKNYNEKCDIWSAGAILYIMLSGIPPFQGKTDPEIFKKVKKGKYDLISPVWNTVSKPAKDLLQKLMTLDPNIRVNAREALRHPWLRSAMDHPIDRNHSERFLMNLQNFHPHKKLQQLTLSFIASQLTTKTEQEEMLELFKKLDFDNNGTLSKQDLKNGISQFKQISDMEIDRIMIEVDIDESGEIDYSEFLTACFSKRYLLSREKLEMAFQEYDTSHSGAITKDDLKDVLGKDHSYDDSIWQMMIEEADKNKDGVIDIDEFSEMMLSLLDM
jgi:calcium-dependent protein kinase